MVNELEALKYENSKLIQNKEKFFDNDKKLKDQNLNLLTSKSGFLTQLFLKLIIHFIIKFFL